MLSLCQSPQKGASGSEADLFHLGTRTSCRLPPSLFRVRMWWEQPDNEWDLRPLAPFWSDVYLVPWMAFQGANTLEQQDGFCRHWVRPCLPSAMSQLYAAGPASAPTDLMKCFRVNWLLQLSRCLTSLSVAFWAPVYGEESLAWEIPGKWHGSAAMSGLNCQEKIQLCCSE